MTPRRIETSTPKQTGARIALTRAALSYDTQDVVGDHTGPVADPYGALYYVPFTVNVADLNPGYVIHFDFYAYLTQLGGGPKTLATSSTEGKLKKGKLPKVEFKFAPFSHDGEGGHIVPDGGLTVILLGIGLTALAGFRTRVG